MSPEPVPRASSKRIQGALLGILLLGLVLNAVGISWGLPTPFSMTWAYDELSPNDRPFEARTHHGGRYPPLHYWVLEAAYWPVELLDKVGAIDLSKERMRDVLRLVGRSVTILMSLASLWLLYRLAILVLGRKEPALLAAGLMALSPTYVYYSKLMNVDVPYCFWFLVAAIFSLRILEHHRTRDYIGFGFAALFAITTKDQAFALFVLPSLAFPFILAHHEKGRADLRGVGRFLFDRRLLLPAGLCIVGFIVIHNFAFDWNGFLHHIWMMLGPETQRFSEHPPTVMGHLAMAWQAVGHIRFVLGTGAALASVVGIWMLARERRYRAIWLLLFPVSYYLFFITPIRYHYDRFFIPVGAVLAIFAGHVLWQLVSAEGSLLVARRLVVAVALAIGLMRVVVLDAAMVRDTRYEVERWSAEQEATGATVVSFLADRQRVPRVSRFMHWRPLRQYGVMGLVGAGSPDFLIFNPMESLWEGTYHVVPLLVDGSFGYELTYTYGPTWDFRRLIPPEVNTNLETISPEISVTRRAVELFFDAGKTTDELWSGRRSDWPEVGRRFLEALVCEGCRELGRGVLGFSLYSDRWSKATSPVLLAGRNITANAVTPRLTVFPGNRRATIRARVVGPGVDLLVDLPTGVPTEIELPETQPGEVSIVAVAAEQAWSPGNGERELGVRVGLGLRGQVTGTAMPRPPESGRGGFRR
jgi:hypothetical protein